MTSRDDVRFAPGSHLKVDRGVYTHHGVYVGQRGVIHFSGEPLEKANASIRRDDLEAFAAGGTIEVVEHARHSQLPASEVVARAEARLDERGYDLIWNNCEHFAIWCVVGQHASPQVERVRNTSASFGAAGAANVIGAAMTASGAGFVGAAGTMHTIAAAGAVVGGGAIAGVVALGAIPSALACGGVMLALKHDPEASPEENAARRDGKLAAPVGAAAGAVGSVAVISAAGTVSGLSAAGFTSGVAAIGATIGGGMVAGTAIAIAAPAVIATGVGLGIYALARRLRGGGAGHRRLHR